MAAKAKSKTSSRLRSRKGPPAKKVRTKRAGARAEVPADWRKLFELLPGYDPIATAKASRFSVKHAEHVIHFFEKALKHIEGSTAGQPFILQPWQKAKLGCLFGWRRVDGSRRYREAFWEEPRKNGKSPVAAGTGLYCFNCEGEAGSQIFCAASDTDTASLVFRHMGGMIDQSPELARRLRVYKTTRTIVKRGELTASIRVLSGKGETKHGGNTHVVIIDELHVVDRELVEVLQTSMASAVRKNPLMLYITTSDYMRESICNEKYEYAKKVCSGAVDDEAFLPVIFEAAPEDDWKLESTWEKANPNIDVSVSREYLRRECEKAKVTPGYEGTFRRLHLNQRTDQESVFIPLDLWNRADSAADPVEWRKRKLEEHRGDSCVGGLDLGSVSDVTGLVLLFDAGDGGVDALPFFWVPRETAEERERKDEAPYATWIEKGFFFGTDGERTDYDQVRRDLNELSGRFGMTEIGVDALFQGEQLIHQLEEDGINAFAFSMAFKNLVAPVKKLIDLVAAEKFHHGNNPVMRWMLSNTAGKEWQEYIVPVKARRGARIDGIICTLMGLSRWMVGDTNPDYYEDNELFIVGGDEDEDDEFL